MTDTAATLIDERIATLGDWRSDVLTRMRALVLAADRNIVEEWKWNNPVWSCNGIVCTGEAYKKAVKLTFAHGAMLPDPNGLFNASLDGNTRRAIDIREGEHVNARHFQALVKAAVKFNGAQRNTNKTAAKPSAAKPSAATPVRLLSGGNPQIPKGDGDAPVQAYIDAMPEWKQDIGRKLDTLIVNTVPNVEKAVKWNTPMYGVPGQGFFIAFHVFTHYIKVTFFYGNQLTPVPPVPSKDPHARYEHLREGEFDEAQMKSWIAQAAAIPGWKP